MSFSTTIPRKAKENLIGFIYLFIHLLNNELFLATKWRILTLEGPPHLHLHELGIEINCMVQLLIQKTQKVHEQKNKNPKSNKK